MKDNTKRWINEIAYGIYYLGINEPWLSCREIKSEVQDYYSCTDKEFKAAGKIAECWYRYGYNN